jgi:hypothetical protein
MRSAWRAGAARLLAKHAKDALVLEDADGAVSRSWNDPEAHLARGHVLYNRKDLKGALAEFEQAVALRPRDYFLWLYLGRARDEAGDSKGALTALREAVRLAPHYSEPHWQFGNALLRVGQLERAFTQMRQATLADPTLLPVMIDLAWGFYGGDAAAVEQVVQPRTDSERIGLARLFVRKGKVAQAVALFRAAGKIKDEERLALLNELLSAKRFKEAYEVWASGRTAEKIAANNGVSSITDPGFEGRVDFTQTGFDWQLTRDLEGIHLSIGNSEPREGRYSLLLEWFGNANPSSQAVRQLILVEPNARYHLSFAVRTKEVVTGGLPILAVRDASSQDPRLLIESKAFPQGTSGWQEYAVEFKTAEDTVAIIVSVQRQGCSSSPCPMFGKVWLDNLSLQKI